MTKRKVCFIITNFIHYSRNLLVLDELKKRADVELHVVLGGAAVLPKYTAHSADIAEFLRRDGFENIHRAHFNLEGSEGVTRAKTAGLGAIEFASAFHRIKPDVVVVKGDRFEVLPAAAAAVYMNIPVAHIEGGDVTGTIDESVRHAITKFAHIHFPTNEEARRRLLQMGERPEYVFNYGSPDVEVVKKLAASRTPFSLNDTGSGAAVDLNNHFLMVMFHPVTSEVGRLAEYARTLLSAVHESGMPVLWFWPNFDTGHEEISHELRIFQNTTKDSRIRFLRYLPPRQFLSLLHTTSCLIGNSSAGLKECSFLGVPVINIGTRQNERLRAANVADVEMTADSILTTIKKQLAVGRYPSSDAYAGEDTAKKMAEKLAMVPLYIQKQFVDA